MEQKVTAYLRQMKEARGCTQQQIADESGVPIGTVGKYLAGIADEAAGYDAVRRLVVCLGGSLDELAGLNTDAQKAEGDAGQAYKAVIAGLEARLDEKDERIEHRGRIASEDHQRAEEAIAYERRRARIAMAISYIVMGLFVLMFFIDWMIPSVGWIRGYDSSGDDLSPLHFERSENMAVKRNAEAIWIEAKGYWQVKVQLDGKRKAFTSSIKGRKGKHEAEGKADEWLEKGTTEMRFDAAWALFLEDQKQRTGTANWKKHEYLGRIYLLPELGNTRLSKITPNMWRACIDAGQRNGLSRRSLQNIKLSISAFVNFARRERWEIELLERGDLPITKDAPEANRKILQPVALKTLFTEDTIIH